MRIAFDASNSIYQHRTHLRGQLQRTCFHNLAVNALHANSSTNLKTNNQPSLYTVWALTFINVNYFSHKKAEIAKWQLKDWAAKVAESV